MQSNIGAVMALNPMPIVVVGAMVDGKPNWTEVAHSGIVGMDRIMVSMVKAHHTNKGIRETGKVSVCLVDEGMLREADIAGVLTGNKDDKSGIMPWHPGTSGAPIPDRAPVVMECEVYQNVETEGFDNFILDIRATWVQEELLTDGKIDSSKVGAVLFDGPTYSYVRIGETICPCTSLAKKS